MLDIQKQLVAAKRNGGSNASSPTSRRASLDAMAKRSGISLFEIAKPSVDSIDPSLLGHTMVLLKVNLYIGRLLRGVQPLQALQYYEACLEHVVASSEFIDGSIPTPSTIQGFSSAVSSVLDKVIAFVDVQRASAAAAANAAPAAPFGPELQALIVECCTYLCSLDHTGKGSIKALFYLGLHETFTKRFGPVSKECVAAPSSAFELNVLDQITFNFHLCRFDDEWRLRIVAQLYGALNNFWWASDAWLAVYTSTGYAWSLHHSILAGILCDDLVRLKRLLLTEAPKQQQQHSRLTSFLKELARIKVSRDSEAWDRLRLEWTVTKSEISVASEFDCGKENQIWVMLEEYLFSAK